MQDLQKLLATLRGRYNQRELAQSLGITTRTLRRWEVGETDPPPYAADAIRQRLLPLAEEMDRGDCDFRFIDLFAGIGGIRAIRAFTEIEGIGAKRAAGYGRLGRVGV